MEVRSGHTKRGAQNTGSGGGLLLQLAHGSVVAVADDHEQGMLRRRLGFWDGVALVVGLMVRMWWMMLSMHERAHHGQLAGNLCRWGVEYSHPQATL